VDARARTRARPERAETDREDAGGSRHAYRSGAAGGRNAALSVARADDGAELVHGFAPETELENAVISTAELREGLAWGRPRPGHPEGAVAVHVADLLAAIDAQGIEGEPRRELRFLALVHDSFKNRVQEWRPKTGANHHAARARRFAERFTDDERLLATLELHDRPYALWRKMRRKGTLDEVAFDQMMRQVPDPELFLRFIELDGGTEGKHPEPVEWFREELRRRGILG
jgi:hypothetical protein